MRRRPLPTAEEALEILKRRRTRPQFRPPPPAGKSLAPLIKQLDEKFGQGPVKVQAAPVAARPRRKPPLDAAQERDLADSLADQPEGGLKDALLKLGRGVLRDPR